MLSSYEQRKLFRIAVTIRERNMHMGDRGYTVQNNLEWWSYDHMTGCRSKLRNSGESKTLQRQLAIQHKSIRHSARIQGKRRKR